MPESTHQLAAAQAVGQVVLLVVLAVEQHQTAAIVECMKLGLIQRRGLLQAVGVALQQLGKASAGQST